MDLSLFVLLHPALNDWPEGRQEALIWFSYIRQQAEKGQTEKVQEEKGSSEKGRPGNSLIGSFPSNQMSDCERIAQDK